MTTEKNKKAPKKPKLYKKGKWNPDYERIDEDKYKEGKSSELQFDCCIRCNNKNVIRACNNNN